MYVAVRMPAEVLFHIGGFGFTNTMLTMLIIMAALVGGSYWTKQRLTLEPTSRWQMLVEMVLEFLLDLSSTLGHKLSSRLLPVIATLFIYIIVSNWSGLLPLIGHSLVIRRLVPATAYEAVVHEDEHGSITEIERVPAHVKAIPVLRPPTSDFSNTAGLAVLAIVIVQILGIQYNGIGGYLKHMADPPFLFPIHLISEISHVVSLAARLFGNIFGGEVLLAVMYTIAPWGIPAIFLGLESLFGFIQALVFSVLFIVYIALAVGHGAEHEAAH